MKKSELVKIIKEEIQAVLKEKAVSQAQQQAAGAALAVKRGEAPKSGLKGGSKSMVNMTQKELEKIASTKHKGLPKKVEELSQGEKMANVKAKQADIAAKKVALKHAEDELKRVQAGVVDEK